MASTDAIALLAWIHYGSGDGESAYTLFGATLDAIATGAIWILLVLLPLVGLFYLAYYLLSLPLRRQERARFFLDFVEAGLKNGGSLERTLVSISQSQDSSVGVHFHLLAAWLEKGLRLTDALEKTPSLAPANIVAMLKVGGEIGDIGKVLPACRALLHDGAGRVRKGSHYLMVLAFGVTPFWMAIFSVLTIWVLPKLREIALDMEGSIPPYLDLLAQHQALLFGFHSLLLLALYTGALMYIGGPRMIAWLEAGLPNFSDWCFHRIPWHRNRMHRNFSTMLAVLLDAGLPEEKAVLMAAESTANRVIRRRAELVAADLRHGLKLDGAMRHLDEAGEFKWRLAQASRARSGFRAALACWHEALDVKAFQQEQAATHSLTSALVLYNGAVVGLIVVGVFQFVISITEGGVLW
jgi:type II secretory pathway component PulF